MFSLDLDFPEAQSTKKLDLLQVMKPSPARTPVSNGQSLQEPFPYTKGPKERKTRVRSTSCIVCPAYDSRLFCIGEPKTTTIHMCAPLILVTLT
jgi:hypothetical protein